MFTDQERAWISEHQEIRLGVLSDHAPYSFFRHGQVMGWSIDLWRLIEERSGLTLRFRMGNWTEIYNEFLVGRLDAIDEISRTEERAKIILFTDPYHLRRTHVFQDRNRPIGSVHSLEDLKGKRVGIIKDIYYGPALRGQGLVLEDYVGYRDMVAALAFGWIDAALAPELTGDFFARENGFSSVASLGAPAIAGLELEDFRIGVLRSNPILHAILSKALADIPDRDLAAITDKWRAYRDGFEMGSGPMRLLPAEQAFIDGAPVIRVGFMPDYEPFSFLKEGLGQGFSLALAQSIADRVGLTIEPVFDSWPNLLDRFRAEDIQVMANISRTKEREAYTLFTREYHRIPNAVFLRAGDGTYGGLDDLRGKKIAIGRDIFYQDRMIERFGRDAIRTYSEQAAMMRALAKGEVDAVVMALNNGTAWIRKLGLINIMIGGEFRMDGVDGEDLRFGVVPSLPYLRSILDRAVASTPPSQWQALETRWLGPPLAESAHRVDPLTPEDKALLAERGVIHLCVDPAMPPFEMLEDGGTYQGVAADVIDLLATRGGFRWDIVPGLSWQDSLDALKAGRCDIAPFAMKGPGSSPALTITPPYLNLPAAIATLLHQPYVSGMGDLVGKPVGYVAGRAASELLARRYPDVPFEPVPNEAEGLRRVHDGTLYGMVGTLASLGHLITRDGRSDMKISGRVPEDWHMGLGLRADDPDLARVMEHLVESLDEAEVLAITNRWIAVRFDQGVDYGLVWRVALIALLLIAAFVYWNRKLQRLNSALAVANNRLKDLSLTDPLTGLANRQCLDQRSEELLGLCQRAAIPLTTIMIDVDHFKAVNDTEGHAFGDAVLVQLARILKRHFQRHGEGVARFGGEEFTALQAGAREEEVEAHLEALRAEVEGTVVDWNGVRRSVTVSIGWHHVIPQPKDKPEALRDLADRALYAAKAAGRNRVVRG